MTPGAQHAAVIEILDIIATGTPAAPALTRWARGHRFAGSGDRRAIRDVVFSVLRQRRSCARAGGGADREDTDGRALVLGYLRSQGIDPTTIFSGEGHAPGKLCPDEQAFEPGPQAAPDPVRLDFPDWLEKPLKSALGPDFEPTMQALRHRAPIFLRVNQKKTDPAGAIVALAADQIDCTRSPLAPLALEVTGNAARIAASKAYLDGLVELQDASSQAVIAALDLPRNGRILDFCAGGGGKALAMAAESDARIFAHDAKPQRLRDLPARSERAAAGVRIVDMAGIAKAAPFDLVLCDVPCSGSGAWRRDPGGKWRLTESDLVALERQQAAILQSAARLVGPGGGLAYVTCSILQSENSGTIRRFLAENNGFEQISTHRFSPVSGGDGMFGALLKRE